MAPTTGELLIDLDLQAANRYGYLDLSHRRLTALPPEIITQLTKLTSLYLDSNQLTALPPEIARRSRHISPGYGQGY